jgi:hypothetical protein
VEVLEVDLVVVVIVLVEVEQVVIEHQLKQ